jgi:hypothetical protein
MRLAIATIAANYRGKTPEKYRGSPSHNKVHAAHVVSSPGRSACRTNFHQHELGQFCLSMNMCQCHTHNIRPHRIAAETMSQHASDDSAPACLPCIAGFWVQGRPATHADGLPALPNGCCHIRGQQPDSFWTIRHSAYAAGMLAQSSM